MFLVVTYPEYVNTNNWLTPGEAIQETVPPLTEVSLTHT
jgi:hypothetical protein